MNQSVQTLDGWYCLQVFYKFNWKAWKLLSSDERQVALDEFIKMRETWHITEDKKEGSFGVFQVTGHKADIMLMFLRSNMEELNDIMRSHSMIGRSYAGKVKQIILGSVGLDDFEWGVALFADDVLQFKKLIYEMRFDEVSARYGEFGSFFVGQTLSKEKITRLLHI